MNEQIKGEIKYKLKVPFKYSVGGSQKDAKELVIKAPSNEIDDEIIKIEEYLGKIDNKMQELIFSKIDISQIKEVQKQFEVEKVKQETQNKEMPEEERIKQIVSSLRTVEGFKDCLSAFCKILEKTCKVDGLEPFTDYMYKQLNPKETKYLLGKYIVNFIGASQ
jgi:hypothetical protein